MRNAAIRDAVEDSRAARTTTGPLMLRTEISHSHEEVFSNKTASRLLKDANYTRSLLHFEQFAITRNLGEMLVRATPGSKF